MKSTGVFTEPARFFCMDSLGFYSQICNDNHTTDSGGSMTLLSAQTSCKPPTCLAFSPHCLGFLCNCLGFSQSLECWPMPLTPVTRMCWVRVSQDVDDGWHVDLMSQQLDVSLGTWQWPADTTPNTVIHVYNGYLLWSKPIIES